MESPGRMIKQRLLELGVSPKRSLGQNFLTSKRVVEKIIDHVRMSKCENIFEVGPGLGSLTEELLGLGKNLSLIEMDRNFAEYWRNRKLNVIELDVLKMDWSSIVAPTLLVGNLPYQVASRLVIEVGGVAAPIYEMIFMFQKEVAQRINAQHGTEHYGFLSVAAQWVWSAKTVTDASSIDFFPKPRVSSRVLSFKRNGNDILTDRQLAILKLGFKHPRKKLLSNLRPMAQQVNQWEKIFARLQLKTDARAESLSVTEWKGLISAFEGDV